MNDSKLRPCKKCGKGILDVVIIDDAGQQKFAVLDPVPAVYVIGGQYAHDGKPIVSRAARETFMVTHFATCPYASHFNKGRKPAKEQPA